MTFYTRTIQIEGITYKQISPTQWQNVNTGQIIDNTRFATIINQYKSKKVVVPVTPSGGDTGACCEVISGILQCTEKREEACSGGCFKGSGTNCFVTEESPDACDTCVYCCYVGFGCLARTPVACTGSSGQYFNKNLGCTACKFGVCSSDPTTVERFYGNGCTGIFIEGGGVASFTVGAYCTGSGAGQTCAGVTYEYVNLTPVFVPGGTCSACIYGACCTGGTCAGITSSANCNAIGGLFFAGSTCVKCDFGAYCQGSTTNRTCIRTGYRGEELSDQFQAGVTCAYCNTGTCCVNGIVSFGDSQRQTNCAGNFFNAIFASDACATGSCCIGATCTENVFRYDCAGVFNSGMTCIACSNGACCLPSGGCTLTSLGNCITSGGTFFGGQTCGACDTGVCCNQGQCTNQRRGNVCSGNFYQSVTCGDSPCILGACCVGGTCIGPIDSRACELTGGVFFGGQTCIACATGANCLTDLEVNGDRSCVANEFLGNVFDGTFYKNQGCSACQAGVCCNSLGGGTGGIRGDCIGSATFYAGQTLFICDAGVFCTGSNEGQTCFGLGHRGQSLTNNFIAGATCNSCVLGACCTGGTCLGGGLTSQAACSSAGGLFFAGKTCTVCDYGVYCTGATCLSLGYRGQSLSNNFIVGATCSSCILGACCTGGTCSGGGQTSQAACNGLFYPGATCFACDYGVYCTGATCFNLGFRGQSLSGNFIAGATCSSCILGACCTGGTCFGGGQTSQAACLVAGGTFYAGSTCSTCVTGVFCTGSNEGQTCFGFGHQGQLLSNNFIAGGTCSSCILGACCTGGSCLGGGLTSQAACSVVGGLFYPGTTCVSCDYGVYCTGSNETTSCLGLGYRAQNLSNQFVIAGSCELDCTYGSCCQGTTCLGITNQGNCGKPNAFFEGHTCSQCDTGLGACCTGGSSSITTITGCQTIGGVFFAEGTTALCVTGSCCTGGTCTQQLLGLSSSCELFITGATCGICDTGVFCTGATCLQIGFRGQSLATVFIVGETCSSCIQGICCKDNYEYLQIAGGKEHSVALTTYGEVRGFGGNTYGQSGMTLALGYTGIAAGFYHTLAISNGGTLMAWGRNQYGQSTVPAGLTGVIQVAAGEYHSIALKFDGGVTCWGWNGQGQCNIPSGLTGVTMISAGGGHNLALKENGTVVAWGYNYDGQTNVPAGLTGVIQVAAGYHHSLALLTDGGITCWGMTLYGQCNIPAGLTASKIAAGGYHTIILKADGGVTAFGRTGYDQTIVPAGLVAKKIAAGEFHSLAINMSNSAVTWGSNINGETNIGSSCELFNQKQCSFKSGVFRPGATQCSACANNVNCCVNGVHSYVLAETCADLGGIAFQGENNPLVCEMGAFCTGRTCIGVTLFGFDLGQTFIADADCSYCIYGTCCEDEIASDTTQVDCRGTFYPGDFNSDICTAGLTYGICCNGATCTSGILQTDCTGFFVDENTATQNNLSCETNACEFGICCKEGTITSVTGGICLGEMTRAECALTGGDFFALTTGATCTNCLYIPMLASALTEKFASNTTDSFGTTTQFNASVTGFTGNQIQPRLEKVSVDSTWITSRDRTLYGSGATTSISFITRETFSGSPSIKHLYRNYAGFTAWYDNTLSLKSPSNSQYLVSEISGGTFDYSPVLGTGRTNSAGLTLGYHAISGSTLNSSGIVRYMRLVLGYGNPSDSWYDTVLVYRAATNASQAVSFYLRDATRHAGLNELTQNQFPSTMPFTESRTDTTYSSPVLIQMFSENPLKYRVRPVGSCCVGATCIGIVTKDHCAFEGGTFHENALCGRCYPTLIYGNCCVGGTHAGYTTFANCNKISGTFFEGPTYSADVCVYGTICTEDRQCYQGISASYYGAFSSTNNKFFIQQNFGSTLGCAACDAGLCCVGGTCMGVKSKTDCTVLGGTIYYDENKCETNCELGVCCETGVTCGTYTNRANCTGYNKVFIDGATLGATCSACSSYLTLTSYSSGVTFTMILNQGTTYGTFQDGSYWVQEKNNLKLLDVKLEYPNATGTTLFKYKANTRLSGLTLTAAGYQGSVYIHGIDKNPLPEQYIHPVQGFTSGNKQGYMSINYNDYDEGWAGPKSVGATDNPNEYDGFDLLKFLNFQNLLKYQGLTLAAGDVVLANASNFDPTKATFPSNAGGYAYQVQKSRANTLSYGVLNCLSATGAALAGSTLCFRPPVSWLPEDLVNRPLYPMSRLDGKIPGQPGNTLINVGTSAVDTNLKYSNVINQAKSLSQTSEFSNAVSYGVVTPMWGMFGARVAASSYGEQYIIPLQQIIQVAYAKNSVGTSLTTEQRKDLIARIAQYGLDSWGGHRLFATCMGSGAGQKAGRTRSWIPLAGYYLGETAMYDPEATMLSDTQRLNKFIESNYTSNSVRTPGGTCASEAEWRIFRYGSTGPENNYAGLRRAIGRAMSHEVNTMIEYVNAPSNLVRHYEYFGSYYRDTNFSGFTTNGATGITFYNEFRSNFPVDSNDTKRVVVSGNFGVMRFGSGTAAPNPFPGRFNAGTKEGSGPSWQGGWMRVISGPGSSGGAGSRYYKVLQSTGFRSDSDTAPSNLGGGYQIVLGQTWADGIPNHTSVLKFYPAGPVDGGITRPSTFHPLGYTYGPIGFLINNNPSSGCASTEAKTDSILFDGSLGAGHNPYFGNSLDAWADQYLLTDYIMKTKGITLISDIAPMPDYIRTYVLTSPYNLTALFTWYSGTSSVWNTWLGISGSWNSASFMATKINFKNHFPGIVNWRGVTIT